MAVFAVHLGGDTDAARSRISKHYAGTEHLELEPTLYLIRANAISETIANNIGLKGDTRIEGLTGIVFKLNSEYSGFTYRAIWNWLSDAEHATK